MLHPRRGSAAPVTILVAAMLVAAGCGGGTTATGSASPSVSPSASPSAPGSSSDGLVSIGAGLRGDAGLAASVYASGLADVAAFAFDASGRLWATTASYTDSGTDAVYLVTAAGASPVAVIKGLHTPLGLLWLNGELYVASKERVDAYSGFDGTTFATVRNVLTLPSGVGEVNGLALGPDGRLRLGISSPCDHCTPTSVYSAAVVSFATDGTGLTVEASRIRAAVGLAYIPGTDDLLVTLNQRDDLGAATPGDWLALVRSGDTFGFPDCYGQAGAACDGTPGPVAVLDPHAAVDGLAVVSGALAGSATFSGTGTAAGSGTSAAGNLAAIVAEWATGKVLEVRLTASGSTYTGTGEPYLTGLTNPVAVALAPDGSLLVGDWGTGMVYRVSAA